MSTFRIHKPVSSAAGGQMVQMQAKVCSGRFLGFMKSTEAAVPEALHLQSCNLSSLLSTFPILSVVPEGVS